ncbi:PREDICTED: nuclear pore complex protein Nup88 [Papilio polytes]|uniref:nuclear pore complex protein Nup88 n=1 Tax=Papilio polytes TaxID=76194 RepID=UPI0006767A66|nr:PREDICTED: nuclear pore complex protein Nup88 [Papilio polytes]
MDSKLYDTILPKHKIFEDLKESLQENTGAKLYNFMELRDDVLYIWNSLENCLFCLNLKHLEEHPDDTPYQRLQLLSPPEFSVERMVGSACGSRLCVYGGRGATLVDLPARWGRAGLFDNGNHTVLCKSVSLDERFLFSQGEVRRVHWHPSSLSHILVLMSDNSIRLYNIALKSGPKLIKSIPIGLKPSSQLAGRTILDSLGDTAVDFTPLPNTDSLLILRGDGEVYMVQCTLDSKSPLQPRLWGPLPIYPPADDNYGSESCSICVLGTGDTLLVVIATCSATLYHCLLLPAQSDDVIDRNGYALYVVESVELNINVSDDAEFPHSYPVHLYPCTSNTYACVHVCGVHTVSLPILDKLKEYVAADEASAERLACGVCAHSSAQHAVRWRGGAGGGRGAAAVRGARPLLLLLAPGGALLTRSLEPYELEEKLYREIQLRNTNLEPDDLNNLLKEKQKLSFVTIIQEILSREASQPLLHLSNTAADQPSPKECLELVTQATILLRKEYMGRQARAASALARKSAALAALAKNFVIWRNNISVEMESIAQRGRRLQQTCALAQQQQEDLKQRCSAVSRRLRAGSAACGGERALAAELQRYGRAAAALQQQIHALAAHARHRADELRRWHEEYKQKQTALGKTHSDTISSVLQQQTSQISSLIEETKLLKDQLSIV